MDSDQKLYGAHREIPRCRQVQLPLSSAKTKVAEAGECPVQVTPGALREHGHMSLQCSYPFVFSSKDRHSKREDVTFPLKSYRENKRCQVRKKMGIRSNSGPCHFRYENNKPRSTLELIKIITPKKKT